MDGHQSKILRVLVIACCLIAASDSASLDVLPPCPARVDDILASDDYAKCRAHVYVLGDGGPSATHPFVFTPQNARVVYSTDACLASLRRLMAVVPATPCMATLMTDAAGSDEFIAVDAAQLNLIITPPRRLQRRRLLTDENGYFSGKLKCKYDIAPPAFNVSDPTQEFVLDCQEIEVATSSEHYHPNFTWVYCLLAVLVASFVGIACFMCRR